MARGRVVLVLTLLVVAGLGVWFVFARWEDANRVATVASALGAVAAIGIAIWAALRGPSASIVVSDTGKATSGGDANTGVRGTGVTSAEVKRTGDAESTGSGTANTGVQLD